MAYIINIELTDLEAKVWNHFVAEGRDVAENFVRNEVRRCFDEVYERESKRLLDDPTVTVMPASREEVVAMADLESAKNRDARMIAEMMARTIQPPQE
jgi:hypothetical protein